MWCCFAGCGGGNWLEFIERVRQKPEAIDRPQKYQQEQKPVLRSLLDRGFTRQMLDDWNIEWDPSYSAMRIPCAAADGRVWSIWRAPEGVQPKYRYEPDFPKGQTLFGYWRLAPKVDQVVLVEGPLDAIWLWAAGLPALAVLGSRLSPEQVVLLEGRVQRAVLCFDSDAAGRLATVFSRPLLRSSGVWVLDAELPRGRKDIQEVPLGDVRGVISGASVHPNGKSIVHSRYERWERKG